jgi:hypothetical protein
LGLDVLGRADKARLADLFVEPFGKEVVHNLDTIWERPDPRRFASRETGAVEWFFDLRGQGRTC